MFSLLPPEPKTDAPAADDAFSRAMEALQPGRSLNHPRLHETASLLGQGRIDAAIALVETHLKKQPRDGEALHLLAEACKMQGRFDDAAALLARAVEGAPDHVPARFGYVDALIQTSHFETALEQLEILLNRDPANPIFRMTKATVLGTLGSTAQSVEILHGLTEQYPRHVRSWLEYGHVLRQMGRSSDCIAAYRRAIEIDPSSGSAYWGLADLKTFRFTAEDLQAMQAQLARGGISADDRIRLSFALGKAYGDAKQFAKSFEHYAKANALQRVCVQHDPDVPARYAARCRAFFTEEFFAARAGGGSKAADPIFIVGMPRSGSTLVEQILASHPQIEGTRELSDLMNVARHAELDLAPQHGTDYPGVLAKLDNSALTALGERYLEMTAVHRKSGRPRFADKMGINFVHIGLIQLILPNAKIVDVRRHPLACCFSNFTQLFAKAQNFTYRQTDLAGFYRHYVELVAHFDRVLPGRVHRILYEDLVAQPEAEIRRLLDYLGLPFEARCLEFYRTERTVSTFSSEQVRTPIYREGLEQWRNYEPWLGPMKSTLGDVLQSYPAVPAFG